MVDVKNKAIAPPNTTVNIWIVGLAVGGASAFKIPTRKIGTTSPRIELHRLQQHINRDDPI
ncbi:MAG: hypothetical protein V7L01_28945 [Nostoc sp.]|uniref:hypothetical protein n=1 Tax=Nostoc sp. TaxID=1180 RepID=UPI002FF87FC8